ncbi:MAG TPA: SMP-30/gluconolactonase/LRE family protein [Candidatus Aquilonibacter sp.]|nr:SMP-30/gluconolactonase/LRE family protein [Candidatus Aquilonibacter sp.]
MKTHSRITLALIALLLAGFCLSRISAAPAPRTFSLQANSPEFWRLVAKDAKLVTLASGFGFTEGPVWDSSGFVYVSDETLNKIFRVYPDGHRETLIELGDPDGNTFDAQHRLIDCASVLRAIIAISPDGKYTVLADHFEGKKFNTPNDVVIGPDRAMYFTDPTLDFSAGEKQETPFQGVYRLDAKGNVELLTKDLSQPNGLAFSPDGKRFYVDDSEQRNIRVYDFSRDAKLTNGHIFGEEPGGKDDGVPDGMKVDRHGHIFVTGPGGIWVWDSAGHHLGTIEMPEQPANLNWGDADYSTLYITATASVYKLKTKVKGFVPYLAASK